MDLESETAAFSIICHFQPKEFVGQKSLNSNNEEIVSGGSVSEIPDSVWYKAVTFI